MVEQIAKTAHEVHRAYCNEMGIKTQPKWEDINEEHRSTILDSVKKILTGKINSREESHDNFVKNKINNGWKFGSEYSDVEKTNPRLVGFGELSLEQRLKESIFFECVNSFKYSFTEK